MPVDGLLVWLAEHPIATIALSAFCLWISVSLILRMWLLHRTTTFFKKVVWSLILFVPLLGWFFYAGCFKPPDYTDMPLPPTPDSMTGGGM